MSSTAAIGDFVHERFKRYFVRGPMFSIPMIITVGILVFDLQFLSGFLRPAASLIEQVFSIGSLWSEIIVLMLLISVVLIIGFVIETVPHGVAAADLFHSAAESIPGIGSFYAGFREMSLTIANGEESFRRQTCRIP